MATYVLRRKVFALAADGQGASMMDFRKQWRKLPAKVKNQKFGGSFTSFMNDKMAEGVNVRAEEALSRQAARAIKKGVADDTYKKAMKEVMKAGGRVSPAEQEAAKRLAGKPLKGMPDSFFLKNKEFLNQKGNQKYAEIAKNTKAAIEGSKVVNGKWAPVGAKSGVTTIAAAPASKAGIVGRATGAVGRLWKSGAAGKAALISAPVLAVGATTGGVIARRRAARQRMED